MSSVCCVSASFLSACAHWLFIGGAIAAQIQFTTGCLPQHSWVSWCVGRRSHNECNHSRMVLYEFSPVANHQRDYVYTWKGLFAGDLSSSGNCLYCCAQQVYCNRWWAFFQLQLCVIKLGVAFISCFLFSMTFNLCTVAIMSTTL